jgi:hypothetical protein
VAYAVGLSEQVRTRFEDVGRVELQTSEYRKLLISKVAHVTMIVVFVLGGVWRAMYGPLSKTPPFHTVGNLLLVRTCNYRKGHSERTTGSSSFSYRTLY